MKGDLTRGFHPDRKRGRRYRRVLLQQGRLLLDSDVAALVDATDQHLRDLGRNLGCQAGSPDLGYLITPGKLQAIFDTLDDVTAGAGVDAVRDFSRKYLDRVPSLKLRTTAAAGSVEIGLWGGLAAPGGTVAFWTRADTAANVSVHVGGGAPATLSVPTSPTFQRVAIAVSVPPGAPQTLTFDLPAATEIWLALVESDEDAAVAPHFWAAPGIYGVDGLWVENPAHGGYPAISFPSLEPTVTTLQQTGGHWVAYLEVHERVVTAAEDPGIREEALGGKLDTTLRTQVVGQVKVVDGGALDGQQIKDAFGTLVLPTGTLVVETASVIPDPDPCAVPLAGGYTGRSNRLYHFEVHEPGGLGAAVIKWSRDGGGPVVPAADRNGAELTFARGSGLENGDLVEVLTDALDVADTGLGQLAVGGFRRPPRAAGVLALLSRKESDAQGRERYDLRDPQNPTLPPVLPTPAFAAGVPVKVRRWDGRIVTTPAGGTDPNNTIALEDGIVITLRGAFEVGDFWQYEARVRQQNANGPWKETPHGPERRFTPLALLQYPANGATSPLELLEWLDERYSRLCTLEADDIAFDGGRLGEPADTVQEIIETILERDSGGCCDVTLRPQASGDDAQRVRDLLGDELQHGGVLCLRPGVYRFASAVAIPAGLRITVRGCPDALVEDVGGNGQPLFKVEGELTLEDLTLVCRSDGPQALIELEGGGSPSLEATRVGFLRKPVAGTGDGIAIRAHGAGITFAGGSGGPLSLDLPPQPSTLPAASLALDACVVVGAAAAVGGRWSTFVIKGSACYASTAVLSAERFDAIELASSVFRTGLPPAILDDPAAATEKLAVDAEAFLDLLAALPPANLAGFVLSAEQLLGGLVRDCALLGGVALSVTEVRGLGVEDCRFRAETLCVHAMHAADLRLRGNQMIVSQTAVMVRSGVRRVFVTDNLFDGDIPVRVGRIDGTDVEGLTIARNDIRARQIGIDLGPPFIVAEARFASVAIHDNRVYSPSTDGFGVGVSLRGIPAAERLVRVFDNEIIGASSGIAVFRIAVEVSNNHIEMPLRRGGIGIHLATVQRATVEDNTIDGMRAGATLTTGILGTGLGDTRIAGNSFRAVSPARPLDLVMDRSRTLEVSNNDFGTGASVITGGDERVILRGNRFVGPLNVAAPLGVVSDCFFGDAGDALVVTSAGEWQASGNRAIGAMRFLPRVRLIFDLNDAIDIPDFAIERRLPPAVAAVAVLGDRSVLAALGHANADDAEIEAALGGSFALRLPGDPLDPPVPGAFELDLETLAENFALVDLGDVWNDDLLDAVLDGFADDLGDDLGLLAFRELAYQAQVATNWANILQVGRLSPADKQANPTLPESSAAPNAGTRVQVTGNRADTRLIVNRYAKRIVAHNLVNDLVEASTQLVEIASPNLEF